MSFDFFSSGSFRLTNLLHLLPLTNKSFHETNYYYDCTMSDLQSALGIGFECAENRTGILVVRYAEYRITDFIIR